jgi:multiple sugar transport system ATP-binding protein
MQRVAIGRALVRDPQVFLMDEPLSNLDFKLREALRAELKRLQRDRGATTLFVTHDQIEALTMADRIAVLNEGRIVQIGTPEDIYDRPATTFVAALVGEPRINLMEARRDDHELLLVGSEIHLPIPPAGDLSSLSLVGVRPEDVRLHRGGEFCGRVVLIEPLGVETIVHIQTGSLNLLSSIPGMTNLCIGDDVRFNIPYGRVHHFRGDGTRID